MQPELTVSIITYNRKALLKRTLQSLERQTLARDRFEVVVVDDGSRDGTPEAMAEFLKVSPCPIRYLPQDKNRGKSSVRNVSIREAKAPLVLFLEDDTIADENLLEEHLKSHAENPSVKLCVLGRDVRPPASDVTPFGRYVEKTEEVFFEKINHLIRSGAGDVFQAFITFNLSVKKSFLLENGIFDPEFRYFCEDIELGYRLSKKGLKLLNNEKAIIYNHHPATLAEYCFRDIRRGYYTLQLLLKHPSAFTFPLPANRVRCFFKDMVYPLLMKFVHWTDTFFKIRYPENMYVRFIDYYNEKGRRKAILEIQKQHHGDINNKLIFLLNRTIALTAQFKTDRFFNAPFDVIRRKTVEALNLKTRAETFWGAWLRVAPPEKLSVLLLRYGYHEEDLSRLVLEFLKPGGVFLDVGAHLGYFSILASEIVGAGGAVFSFEPTPSTFTLLKANTADKQNITIFPLAVYSKDMQLTFQDYGLKYSMFNSMHAPRMDASSDKPAPQPYTTDAVSLDSFVATHSLRPDFIKIDAENAELDILDGMRAILKNMRPLIALEMGDEGAETSQPSRQRIQFMRDQGYCPIEFQDNAVRRHKEQPAYLYSNLLFIPEERLREFDGIL